MRHFLFLPFVMGAFATSAHSDELIALEGVELSLRQSEELQTQLWQGDRLIYSDYMLVPEPQSRKIGAREVMVFFAGAGGNACDAMPMVVWLEGGEARFDGPIEGCAAVTIAQKGAGLEFTTPATLGTEGSRSFWAAGQGISDQGAIRFEESLAGSWEDILQSRANHPLEILQNAAVYRQFESLLGDDFERYAPIFEGVGSGEVKEQGYSGSVCQKVFCQEIFAYLWVDPKAQQVFVALKEDETAELHFMPNPLQDWPDWIKAEVAQTPDLQ